MICLNIVKRVFKAGSQLWMADAVDVDRFYLVEQSVIAPLHRHRGAGRQMVLRRGDVCPRGASNDCLNIIVHRRLAARWVICLKVAVF